MLLRIPRRPVPCCTDGAKQGTALRNRIRAWGWEKLMPWLLALCLLLPLISNAAPVIIVPSDNSSAYTEAESALREKLSNYSPATLPVSNLDHVSTSDTKLIITIGTKALQATLTTNNKTPVLALLVTRKSFRQLVATAPGARQISAIYIDQPYTRQLNLVRLIVPGKQRVGVLFSAESESELAELKRTAQVQKLTLVPEKVGAGDELPAALTKLLSEVDVVLSIPDPSIFNSATIQNILFSAYRAHKPLISFSPYYVRAGAVAAVYSTPTQLAHQAAEMARLLLNGGALAQPQYARDFNVTTNPTAARSLDLSLGDEKSIENKLTSGYEGP